MVADEGAFNRAARRLNLSPPVVTRLITDLESRLGTRLLTRTTRKIALTEAGMRLYADAGRILAALAEAEASAAGDHQAPRGVLRLTAPVLFGQLHVVPLLRDFLDRFPAVSATTLFVDRVVNLIDEGLDVAVRIGDLPNSTLTATRVASVRRVTIAAPGYLAEWGCPDTPADLSGHRIIQPLSLNEPPRWVFIANGKERSGQFTPRLQTNSVGDAIASAKAGWGVTRALSYQVADGLADGSLVEILRDWEDRDMPIHLVHSEGRLGSAKIRQFIDFAATRLRAEAVRLAAI